MLSEKPIEILFVLGAGASFPYQLPVMKELKALILGLQETHPPWFQHLEPNEQSAFDTFLHNYRRSPQESIDNYIENHPEYYEFASLAIAFIIGQRVRRRFHECFSTGRLFTGSFCPDVRRQQKSPRIPLITQDWMGWLLQQVLTNPCSITNGRSLCFVTFNYDTLLEGAVYAMFRYGIRSSASDDEESWQTLANQVCIKHVHGEIKVCANEKFDQIEPDLNWLRRAREGIRLLHERDRQPERLNEIKGMFVRAKRIIFLGFGYDPVNMERVGATSIGSRYLDEHNMVRPQVYCSAYQRLSGEIYSIRERVGGSVHNVTIDATGNDCLAFLREHCAFHIESVIRSATN